jgi:hypothetical protein
MLYKRRNRGRRHYGVGWQKEFFENGAAPFDHKRPTNQSPEQERVAYLEKMIRTKCAGSA